MKQKKILLLGGSYFQVPSVITAKKLGYHVITCDYLSDNPGHKYADEYYNVSTTDYDAVLKLAQEHQIDGILAYASDPAAPTAAYVANKLGLPSNHYDAVNILARKDLFRDYLRDHGFNTPKHGAYESYQDFCREVNDYNFPIIIKPVDSSGSKGVSVVYEKDHIADIEDALKYSRAKKIIAEEYVEKAGYQIAGDGFVCNGELKFRCFANEHFDYQCNGLVPIGESFPYIAPAAIHNKIHQEIQKLLTSLDYQMGALNFDVRIDANDKIFLMEVGPRNGGNLIPEVTKYITGVDMIAYSIKCAMGEDCSELKLEEPSGYYASYILHSLKRGKVKSIKIATEIENCIVEKSIWIKVGDQVNVFSGSNETLGTMIFKFESSQQMINYMDNMNEYIQVEVE